MIRPLGLYGSKDEIVRLLQGIGAIDDKVYVPPVLITPRFLILLSGLLYYPRRLIPVILNQRYHLVCT